MITVKVPATSANMGPGFDALGFALTLYNTFSVELKDEPGLSFEGFIPEFESPDNLVYRSMKRLLEEVDYKEPAGLHFKVKNDIPICSGLGSSSSCVVGGLMLGNALAGDPLSQAELINLATEIEGHPDNVAPALLGNMVIAVQDQGQVYYNTLKVATGLRFIALTPGYHVPTSHARKILPKDVPFTDAVFNVGRTGLLISSLVNGNFNNLGAACQDRLHQPYRQKLVPEWAELSTIAEQNLAKTFFLSGAGPTVILIFEDNGEDPLPGLIESLEGLAGSWVPRALRIDWQGAKII